MLTALLFACHEPALPSTPPPTLITPPSTTSIHDAPVQWTPGERLAWKVTWRGLRVGTARLGVSRGPGPLQIASRFRTTGLAHQMNPINHTLTTTPQSPKLNDLHSAVARVRSWASPVAMPARLFVQHEGHRFQVDLAGPVVDPSVVPEALRIDGQISSGETRLDLSLWLSTDNSHTPVQFTVAKNGNQVHATLIPDDGAL